MATQPEVNQYPKTDWTSDQVEAVRTSHLARGASSSVRTETTSNYILTTTWPVIE